MACVVESQSPATLRRCGAGAIEGLPANSLGFRTSLVKAAEYSYDVMTARDEGKPAVEAELR